MSDSRTLCRGAVRTKLLFILIVAAGLAFAGCERNERIPPAPKKDSIIPAPQPPGNPLQPALPTPYPKEIPLPSRK